MSDPGSRLGLRARRVTLTLAGSAAGGSPAFMRIECPFCHAQSRLPDSKEGSKVRCAACSKVYRAREIGSGASKSSSSTAPVVAIGTVAVAALIALVAMRSTEEPEAAPARVEASVKQAPAPIEAPIDGTGWDSPLVQTPVRIHAAARAGNWDLLRASLDAPRWLASESDADPDAPRAELEAVWKALPESEQEAHVARAVAALTDVGEDGLVAGWAPYDGEVVLEGDRDATVHLSVTPAAGGALKRTLVWRLTRVDDAWRAWSWEEWLTKVERKRKERGYDLVELSDGAVVRERDPEPLGHLDDTPPELRQKIDELLVTMIDLELTAQASRAAREMAAIGKPAIPILLTHLYENTLASREESIQANIVDTALREITGQSFGYQPLSLVGAAMGTTEERRQSAIRQWFAWWFRAGEDFTGPPRSDSPPE